jgi:hypothetical protein
MTYFTFYWLPEGRPLLTVRAASRTAAKREFKMEYPEYARHMGEVYIVENEVNGANVRTVQA